MPVIVILYIILVLFAWYAWPRKRYYRIIYCKGEYIPQEKYGVFGTWSRIEEPSYLKYLENLPRKTENWAHTIILHRMEEREKINQNTKQEKAIKITKIIKIKRTVDIID